MLPGVNEDSDEFLEVGALQAFEARQILPRLEQQGIRFQIEIDHSAIHQMTPVQASFGGTWGNGAVVRLFVHEDDGVHAGKILREFLKV
jgi:hypothetical protein